MMILGKWQVDMPSKIVEQPTFYIKENLNLGLSDSDFIPEFIAVFGENS